MIDATHDPDRRSWVDSANGHGQFYGDYIGMDVSGNTAIPIWADTRDPELFTCRDSMGHVTLPPSLCTGTYSHATGDVVANEENIYVSSVTIPNK